MGTNMRYEEFKKNNEHKSVITKAHEDMFNRKKEEQRNSKEERREKEQEIQVSEKCRELTKGKIKPFKIRKKKKKKHL